MEKGTKDQLALSTKACSDSAFRKKYSIIVDESRDIVIQGCLVTNHRLFSGMHLNEFPVRNLTNLSKFIQEGRKIIANGETEKVISLWEKAEFSPKDLIIYLGEETPYYKCIFDAQFEVILNYRIGTVNFGVAIYPIDENEFVRNFDNSKFHVVK